MQSTIHTPDQGKSKLSHVGAQFFKLIEFDDKEELLLEVRKHSFGLILLIVTGILIAFAVFLVVIVLASVGFLSDVGLDSARPFIALLGFILAVLAVVVTGINAQLYRSNVVYVTNEKIAQVLYVTLFHRKISQLNIGDVQDVTVTQQGFLAHAFNYGTLVIETAGEQQNYTFTFVPEPHEAAKVIITAHEANLKQYGN